MRVFKIDGWEARGCYDPIGSYHIGYFEKREDAFKAAEGAAPWGGNGDVIQTESEIKVYESYEEFERHKAERKIERAQAELQKTINNLTPREKELLGM